MSLVRRSSSARSNVEQIRRNSSQILQSSPISMAPANQFSEEKSNSLTGLLKQKLAQYYTIYAVQIVGNNPQRCQLILSTTIYSFVKENSGFKFKVVFTDKKGNTVSDYSFTFYSILSVEKNNDFKKYFLAYKEHSKTEIAKHLYLSSTVPPIDYFYSSRFDYQYFYKPLLFKCLEDHSVKMFIFRSKDYASVIELFTILEQIKERYIKSRPEHFLSKFRYCVIFINGKPEIYQVKVQSATKNALMVVVENEKQLISNKIITNQVFSAPDDQNIRYWKEIIQYYQKIKQFSAPISIYDRRESALITVFLPYHDATLFVQLCQLMTQNFSNDEIRSLFGID